MNPTKSLLAAAKPCRTRCAVSLVHLMSNDSNTGLVLDRLGNDLGRAVAAAIVHHQDLIVVAQFTKGLIGFIERLFDDLGFVEGR